MISILVFLFINDHINHMKEEQSELDLMDLQLNSTDKIVLNQLRILHNEDQIIEHELKILDNHNIIIDLLGNITKSTN